MNLIDKARDVIRSYEFDREIKLWEVEVYNPDLGTSTMVEKFLNNETLLDQFHYLVNTRFKSTKEAEIPLGTSKFQGVPHLPADFVWPEGYYFYAQFDLAALAAVDAYDLLPKHGMLYVFFDPSADDFSPYSSRAAKIFHYAGSEPLERRPYPAMDALPLGGKYYYKQYTGSTSTIAFEPSFTFYTSYKEGLDKDVLAAIPEDLVDRIVRETGLSFVTDITYGDMFGEPITWQGEEGQGGLFAPHDWDWQQGEPPRDPRRVLFLQNDMGDGTYHFWVYRDALGKLDLSTVHVTASTT